MGSFIAAGSAYANLGKNMIPFYVFYSMFGFQRVGDLIWCAADTRCKGFLCGGTSGRTSLNGEGLQHEDGHSQLIATTVPSLRAYDPAYGYELGVIVQDGLRRMYGEGEEIFYYLSVYNDEEHRGKVWSAFLKHPKWDALKKNERYKDTVSKIISQHMHALSYSPIQ